MTTTTPRPEGLPRCVTCGHFKLNHSGVTKGSRPRRCLANSCECPGYRGAEQVAVEVRKAARGTRPWSQTRLFDPGDEA